MSTSSGHPAQQLIGQVLFSYQMPVERGKIREFAAATGSANPAYLSADPVVPPTFLATSMQWEPQNPPLAARLGVDLSRVLQGGQEYRFTGELPRAGDVLNAETSIESVTEKASRSGTLTVIVVLTRFCGPDGGVVAEGRATVIERAAS